MIDEKIYRAQHYRANRARIRARQLIQRRWSREYFPHRWVSPEVRAARAVARRDQQRNAARQRWHSDIEASRAKRRNRYWINKCGKPAPRSMAS